MKIDLFLFTSKSLPNIWAGIGAKTWAVSEISPANMLRPVSAVEEPAANQDLFSYGLEPEAKALMVAEA